MKAVVVYRNPFDYAREHDEIEVYRESRKASIACKKAIGQAVLENYHGWCLDTATALDQLLEQFSLERICYVLAITVRAKSWDKRISDQNKKWAYTIQVFPDYDSFTQCDQNNRFVVDAVNPGLTNLLINEVRTYAGNHENK